MTGLSTLPMAMAAGAPLLVPDRPAMREIIRHRQNGLIYRPDTPSILADLLASLLRSDPAWRRTLGAAARRYVLDHHAEAVVAGAFAGLLRRLCEVGEDADQFAENRTAPEY